ncbi:2,3-bisphosphoglycerate-dependent phosphoglycerate mutase [Candidatus Woesearchaeota archaeon]|nr:2,3-bisphosphoglycerate-dependent phosphoglycerate mutase [Candidatus Woesearchaeota archaeon]MBW3005516.1 2,3-bisphosphoglycerate-dependent phosphoglycerate mutase [Candidatus Woesearchaeota archaeon]
MSYLILVRHGESRWNLANKFCGWVDVPLSENGIKEALSAAKKLEGLTLDVAFTSKLERAQETLLLILAKQKFTGIFLHNTGKMAKWSKHPHKLEKNEIPIYSDTALNERYYGRLQGMNKDAARRKWGKPQVFKWRRSYDIRPPGGECLKDVYKRTVPYFKKVIMPHIRKKKDVIISAHGNSLRALIKYLDNISDEKIPHLELPTGKPIIYKYTKGKLIKEKHKHSFTRPVHWTRKP